MEGTWTVQGSIVLPAGHCHFHDSAESNAFKGGATVRWEKRKKLQAKIVSASNDKFVIRIGDISKTPKVGDSLVVTIPSRAKVEMVRKTNSLSGVRITDTIARGKVIGVNEGVVTVKPMVSRTNVAKLQSLASTNTMVGVNAIENKMKTFG